MDQQPQPPAHEIAMRALLSGEEPTGTIPTEIVPEEVAGQAVELIKAKSLVMDYGPRVPKSLSRVAGVDSAIDAGDSSKLTGPLTGTIRKRLTPKEWAKLAAIAQEEGCRVNTPPRRLMGRKRSRRHNRQRPYGPAKRYSNVGALLNTETGQMIDLRENVAAVLSHNLRTAGKSEAWLARESGISVATIRGILRQEQHATRCLTPIFNVFKRLAAAQCPDHGPECSGHGTEG